MKRYKYIVSFFLLFLCVFAFSKTKPYSSLVIDARDLPVLRSMSPKILNEKGLEIYGTILDEKKMKKALEIGVVAYITSIEDAKKHLKKRLGDNPLIIKALGIVGSARSNLVISDEDAIKVLRMNAKYHFLDNLRVFILINDNE